MRRQGRCHSAPLKTTPSKARSWLQEPSQKAGAIHFLVVPAQGGCSQHHRLTHTPNPALLGPGPPSWRPLGLLGRVGCQRVCQREVSCFSSSLHWQCIQIPFVSSSGKAACVCVCFPVPTCVQSSHLTSKGE